MLSGARTLVRRLAGAPGMTAAAVVSIALGVGANTAVFSVVYALLIRPLPFPDADRLVRITSVRGEALGFLAVPEQDDLRALPGIFEDVALYTDQGAYNASGFGPPEELPATITTANLFSVLGIAPQMGSVFPSEFDRTRQFGLVISHGLWQRRFGGEPDVVGRTMTLDGAPGYVIHGVMPAGFQFPAHADLFRSAGISPTPETYLRRDLRGRMGLGRLREGVTVAQAQQAVDALAARLANDFPATNAGLEFRLTPLRDTFVGQARGYLWLLASAVALVLLVGAVNVANLLLARALATRRDTVVRLALGASRARIVRETMAESLALAFAGALIGGALAWVGVRAITSLVQATLPPSMRIGLDWPALVALGVFAAISAVVAGVFPVLRLGDLEASRVLREEGRGGGGGPRSERLRSILIGAEVALAVALVAGAGLLARSFQRLQQVDLGFEPERRLTFRVELGWRAYDTHEKVIRFNEQLLEGLARLPGVTGVALDSNLPMSGKPREPDTIVLEGQSDVERRTNPYVNTHVVSASHPDVLGLGLVRGRALLSTDRLDTEPVALVSAALASRLWPGIDPIGRRFAVGTPSATNPIATVVGVVGDIRHVGVREPGFDVYRPFTQRWAGGSWFVAQVDRGDPRALAHAATALVGRIDPDQSFFDVRTLDERVAAVVWQERLAGSLVAVFGAIAAALALVGLTGLVAYLARQRAREVGIRLALGADRRAVVGLFVRRAAIIVAVGVVAGLAVAAAGRGLAAHLVFAGSIRDTLGMLGLGAALGLVAIAASAVAAWRGTAVDPVTALRE
jgi:putative ABC transport system permease protein